MEFRVKYDNTKMLKEHIKDKAGADVVAYHVDEDTNDYDMIINIDEKHAIAIGRNGYFLGITHETGKTGIARISPMLAGIDVQLVALEVAAGYYDYKVTQNYTFYKLYKEWDKNPREFFKANIFKETKHTFDRYATSMEMVNDMLDVAYEGYIEHDEMTEAQAAEVVNYLIIEYLPENMNIEELNFMFTRIYEEQYL